MSETYEAIEKLGEAADTVDNLIGALQLPLDPRMHVEQLKLALPKLSATLKAVYVAQTGDNPWSTHP
jgi:hypothetical protein